MTKYAYVVGFADDGCALCMGTDIQACRDNAQKAIRIAESFETK